MCRLLSALSLRENALDPSLNKGKKPAELVPKPLLDGCVELVASPKLRLREVSSVNLVDPVYACVNLSLLVPKLLKEFCV